MKTAEHMVRVLTVLAVAAGGDCRGAGQPPRGVAHRHNGGTVVTMDGAAACCRRVPWQSTAATSSRSIRPTRSRSGIRRTDTIDASGHVVLPGLINTHTHAPMVLYRGLADDLALMEWLQKYIFPAEAKTVTPEFVRAGTRLAALEMIQSGTTDLRGHVLLRRGDRAGDQGGGRPRRSWPDDHPVSGRRREDAGGGARAGRASSSGSCKATT